MKMEQIQEAFERARVLIKKMFPQFAPFADEVTLEITTDKGGWDIRRCVKERKIQANLYRIEWHFERQKQIPYCAKYDLETAFLHDFFEYCYFRLHDYPLECSMHVIVCLVHQRARVLENVIRKDRGMRPWI